MTTRSYSALTRNGTRDAAGSTIRRQSGEVKPNDWQKDYFQGRDAIGRRAPSYHMTKVKPPHVRFASPNGGRLARLELGRLWCGVRYLG